MKLVRRIKEVDTYIDNIKEEGKFTKNNITVEHRSNNPKRDYLFVNKLQCKHIPTSGKKMVDMCKQLVKLVNDKLANELAVDDAVLVIGFAETATAIGNIVADGLVNSTYVMQTTREDIEDSKELITFEEEHSHATTQKLLTYKKLDVDTFLSGFKYILFVEDEISTGNTILNFIREFDKIKPGMKYGVASICNWQSVENQRKFKDLNIDTFALLRGTLKDSNIKMFEAYKSGEYIDNRINKYNKKSYNDGIFIYYPVEKVLGKNLFKEERLGHKSNRDLTQLYELVDKTLDKQKKGFNSVRVVGTEEFMYIPIKVAEYIEEKYGAEVICHSTTRSPIDVMKSNSYGCADAITSKNLLNSVYNSTRETYLYNVDEYTDLVILVTDATLRSESARNLYELFEDKAETIIALSL